MSYLRLLTPRRPGGIAIVEVPETMRTEVQGMLRAGRQGRRLEGPTPRHTELMLGEDVLDDVLVIPERPGDGLMELHLHGSEAVLCRLEDISGGPLLVAEPDHAAALLLRRAMGDAQLALALEQAAFRPWEAWLAQASRKELQGALDRSAASLALAEACTVVLSGTQNAGKSTLMNGLLQRERVLAGAQAGLTRDPVAEPTTLAGYPYLLVDTAGEGEAVDALDAAAQARGRAARDEGLLLRVVDGAAGPGAADRLLADGHQALVVATKSDLDPAPWPGDVPKHLSVSAHDPAGSASVRVDVGEILRQHRGLPPAGPARGPAPLDRGELAALQRAVARAK